MNDEMTDKISNVLQQVRLLKDKYNELSAATGEDFNIFSILRIKHKEVITHTPILAELLNPHGSHHQGAAFLKLFLKICIEEQEYTNPKTFRVRSEEPTEQGQFDIILQKENEACIVIENKIGAKDQISQLNRYYQDAIAKGFSANQIKLIYLTLDGSPPKEKSLIAVNGQGSDLSMDRVILRSYRTHIISWLEECMKLQELQRISPIREILFQYRDLLNELTQQPTNRRYSMELKDILVRDENYELIPDLEEMLLEFNVHVQLEFWNELTRIMTEEDRFQCHDNQGKEASEVNIRNYYTTSTNRLHFGKTFGLDIIWEQTKIALRVELSGSGWIGYGFVLFNEDGIRVESCKDNGFNTLAGMLPDNDFERTNGWIGWKYPARKVIFPPDYSRRNIEHLQDDRNRRELVQELVTEIANAVNQLRENLN